MALRDLFLTAIIFGLVPLILSRPYIGVLAWSWLGYMNPHRLTWGFAYNMPFSEVIAAATLVSVFFSKEPKRIPITFMTVAWLAFILWMGITTLFAVYPDHAWDYFERVIKIQLITFLTIMVMCSKQRLVWLVWIIVLSIGFYSIKGGIFTIITGGGARVWGPDKSFIAENNSLALATLMTIPLMNFLYLQTKQKWLRWSLLAAMLLSFVSVLGSHSRGAIIAIAAVALFFWLKSKAKLITALAMLVLIPSAIIYMPDNWTDRANTILSRASAGNNPETFAGFYLQQPIPDRDWLQFWPSDRSALGRVNAWNYSINVANHRFTGAGFESWEPETFADYAPIVNAIHAAHSIYFGVLGDHGWIGFLLYLTIFLMAWRTATQLIRSCRDHEEMNWLADLARMIQVSLIAYATGGAFLSLSYFDLPWHLVAILVIGKMLADQYFQIAATSADQPQRRDYRKTRSISSPPQDAPARS